MDVKRDILWRVYLCFIVMIVLGATIVGKAFYIQQVQGKYWESMSDSLHQKIQEIAADRGTIYSDNGQMLSTSIPQFDVYIDFGADGLREKSGKRFKENLDSLSIGLADLFKDKNADAYKQLLRDGYRREVRYYPLKKNVNYRQYQALLKLPLIREGRNKSGFIAEINNIRLNPYQMLGYRTIGLYRTNSQSVGLEATYDTLLKGTPGKRLVRFIAGGVAIPVDEAADIEPQNGKDIISTIDIHMQEIAENALMKMMVGNQAKHGTAIVIDVKTGQIKAIANLGIQKDGSYWEDMNYAILPTEPGSIFKLATMLALLEDHKIHLNDPINLDGGHWTINGRTVNDAEDDENANNVLQAFEASSNVGMAKLVYYNYASHPEQFVNHVKKLGLGNLTGVDITGERHPYISTPGDKIWSATTLPWMAFGYSNLISPLGIAMLYNAIANNGKMMKPYLVSDIMYDGNVVKHIDPVQTRVVADSNVVRLLQQCLYGVCNDPHGTGYTLLKDLPFKLCGKTGTALVAQGSHGYADKIYQSAFAGYFPADNPQYTCVVEIVNSPHSRIYYGAAVAGPVFKEIAERLYTLYVRRTSQNQYAILDSLKPVKNNYNYLGSANELQTFANNFGIKYTGTISANTEWAMLSGDSDNTDKLQPQSLAANKSMPNLSGMGLKDALYLCESLGLKVNVKGVGRVTQQSLMSGVPVARGQRIDLVLNN